jgi:ketosteroid isomerase-like protein
MSYRNTTLAAASFAFLVVPAVFAATPLDTLVATERAFAARSVEKGMNEAFLAYLADDGILFRPGPVNGRSLWLGRPRSRATLDWAPSFAEISGLGDLGFTAGPWTLRPAGDGERSHGHFVTVWKRDPEGPWRVAVDMGISHERARAGLRDVELRAGPTHAMPARRKPRSGFMVGGAVFRGGSGFGLGIGSYVPDRDEEYHRNATRCIA